MDLVLSKIVCFLNFLKKYSLTLPHDLWLLKGKVSFMLVLGLITMNILEI